MQNLKLRRCIQGATGVLQCLYIIRLKIRDIDWGIDESMTVDQTFSPLQAYRQELNPSNTSAITRAMRPKILEGLIRELIIRVLLTIVLPTRGTSASEMPARW